MNGELKAQLRCGLTTAHRVSSWHTGVVLPNRSGACAAKCCQDHSQNLEETSSDVLVVAGNLNAGSSVTHCGDICILGRLSGRVHAGSKGNRRAVIRAFELDSDAIQIADVTAGRFLKLQQATLITCASSGALELRPQNKTAPEHKGAPKRKRRRNDYSGIDALLPQSINEGLSLVASASAPAKAALFTGFYILMAGLLLFLAPLKTFTLLFDQRSVAPVWIRVGGVLASLFGFYYIGAAHGDMTGRGLQSFYRSTVYGRLFLVAAFSVLVALKKSQWQLLILAAVNGFGAFSMHRSLTGQ